MTRFDFDNIAGWHESLTRELAKAVTEAHVSKMKSYEFEYWGDALDHLYGEVGRTKLIECAIDWLINHEIIVFHGTRVSVAEAVSISAEGLIPLCADDRKARLVEALSANPRWSDVEGDLDTAISDFGPNNLAGKREGLISLTLSRSSLIHSFDHYVQYGSEFDQHVVQRLLGLDGLDCLKEYGTPKLVCVCLNGSVALDAAHPYFTVEDIMRQGDTPNIIRQFLSAWCERVLDPSFESKDYRADCGLQFESRIPARQIICIEDIDSGLIGR